MEAFDTSQFTGSRATFRFAFYRGNIYQENIVLNRFKKNTVIQSIYQQNFLIFLFQHIST